MDRSVSHFLDAGNQHLRAHAYSFGPAALFLLVAAAAPGAGTGDSGLGVVGSRTAVKRERHPPARVYPSGAQTREAARFGEESLMCVVPYDGFGTKGPGTIGSEIPQRSCAEANWRTVGQC